MWRWSQVARWAQLPADDVEKAEWIAVVKARLQFELFDTPKERAMLKEVAGILSGKR